MTDMRQPRVTGDQTGSGAVRETTNPHHRSRSMNTAYKPPVTPPTFEPLALAFLADLWGVEVTTTDDIPRVQCGCQEEGAVTTVRVYGDPNPHESTTTAVTDVCVHCMERAVKEAHAHQWDKSRNPIRVEIAPMPAGWQAKA